MRWIAVVAVAFFGLAAGGPARGEIAGPGSPAEAPPEEAQLRFQRAVDLYKEGDLDAAFVEFKRAHELVPSYKILYNLGQVSYQRRDYASALRYFRRYLGEGGTAVPIPRQHEVAGDIARLEERVGQVEVEAGDAGAEVLLDDLFVGRTPLAAPIVVNSGRRKVDVVVPGGTRQTRQIEIAGGEVLRLAFPKAAPKPNPAVDRLPGQSLPGPRPPLIGTTSPAIVSQPRPERRFPWKSWTLTGILAAGAATTGTFAWLGKRELDQELATFPADPFAIEDQERKTRGFALATDGLLLGTAILATISLYLTYRDPR